MIIFSFERNRTGPSIRRPLVCCADPLTVSLAKFAISARLAAAIRRENDMPTRNISLTPEQDAFIEEAVKSGEYQNASEAVRDALRALQQRRREDALKLEALRRQIDVGIAALERGQFTEIAEAELDAYIDGLAARSDERAQ